MVTTSAGRLYRRCVELLSLALRSARRHRLSAPKTRTIMSEYEIPFHIQEEIMKRLPVKSLVRFRSVSKAWKSLIDSLEFIAAHTLRRHTQSHHLLVSCGRIGEGVKKYVSYVDDDTSLRKKSVLTPPPYVKQLQPIVLGSSHGLLGLYGYDHSHALTTAIIVLWNPSIRKSFVLAVPFIREVTKPFPYDSIVERSSITFGVCPVNKDPKIVSIIQCWDKRNVETSYRCKVMVYALSSGKWRNLSTNLPTKPFENEWWLAITDDFLYWPAILSAHNIVMSFNVTNESVKAIDLPDSLACHGNRNLRLSNIRESLAIIQSNTNNYTIWIMKGGVQRLFTKLFTIKEASYSGLVGFRKSGTPMMQVSDDNEPPTEKLVVYEPNLEHNSVMEITGSHYRINVNPYMETLLLLGRSDSSSY